MEVTCVNILLVDGQIGEESKIKSFLKQGENPSFRIWHHNSRASALQFLKFRKAVIDIIVLDLFTVDPGNTEETYKIISRAANDTPIIVMTDRKAHSLAREVIAGGAADVVVRERFDVHPKRLLDAIEFSLLRAKLLLELKEKIAEEIRIHQHMLHLITGGYSVESDTVSEVAENRRAG